MSNDAFLLKVERAHFRTDQDTGANPAVMIIWNMVRQHFGKVIQTNKIQIEAHGVTLVVRVGFGRDKCLNLQWGPAGRLVGTQHAAFVPTSFQAAEIRAKENMR